MKEKELRLALVFFGGVSLAIYQHGINRELLNLVRASKAYHGPDSFEGKQDEGHSFAASVRRSGDFSTEEVYFDLLKEIGRSIDLRVIVDVIAGSSAGGINGIALARALAHDLSLAPLTDLWLAEADMSRLLAPEAKARAWSKWYFWPVLYPVLARLSHEGMFPGRPNVEMRESVSLFLRSRWFKPPLDGRRLTHLLLDGLNAMDDGGTGGESLLPTGIRLDLLVTVTDFHGTDRAIFIHDPLSVREREHRHILRFAYYEPKVGKPHSDFDYASIPSLAFAGRASASYPGAFPPAQLGEIDEVLMERRQSWRDRAQFLGTNFSHYQALGMEPENAVLVDGSVLDNKPILATIEVIRTHSAFREVDRRLVYIDPHRSILEPRPSPGIPGFFTTLRGALTDLPRNEPIYDELAQVSWYNGQIGRLKAAVLAARDQVSELIEQSTGGGLSGPYTVTELRHWRLTSTNLLASTPIVYNAWMRALVLESVDFLVGVLRAICQSPRESPHGRWLQTVMELWAERNGILGRNYVIPPTVARDAELPPFAKFIVDFGIDYKKRRLSFVIQEINNLYPKVGRPPYASTSSKMLDELKKRVYQCLDNLDTYSGTGFLSAGLRARAAGLLDVQHGDAAGRSLPEPAAFVQENEATISDLVAELGREGDLVAANEDADDALSSSLASRLDVQSRHDILTGYLGYFYWDILLRPTASAFALGASPIDEVLIDRISPEDAATIVPDEAGIQLGGGAFAGFGGFLSRTTRENDYLWGRLHGVDRLFDIVMSSVPEQDRATIDIRAYKKRAFRAILRDEAARLTNIAELVEKVWMKVEAM